MRSVEPDDPVLSYAAVLDALPIVAYIARPDGSIAYVSRAWADLFGYDGGIALGLGYRAIIHPDHLERAITVFEGALASQARYRDELPVRFGDGSYRWVRSQAEPLRDRENAVIGWFGTVIDIEDQRLAQSGLLEHAEFSARLIASSEDCIKVLDAEGRLISMSENGQALLGVRDFEAIRGTPWVETWSADQRPVVQQAVDAARGGSTGRFVGYFPVDDEPRWFDVIVTAFRDELGIPRQLLAVSRDVTLAHQTQQALRESEARYRAFSEALPGMTWSAGSDGRLDYISRKYDEMRPRTRESALGEAWLESVHADDRAATSARWRHSLTTGEPYEAQFRIDVGGGNYRWHMARALPMRDAAGAIVRWVGVNMDVDDQRRADDAREMFVALVENSDDFIGIADSGGRVMYVNAAGRDLLELGSLENALAAHTRDYLLPEDRAFVRDTMLPAVFRDGHWIGDFRLRNFQTNQAVPVGCNLFQIRGTDGEMLGIATVSRDRRQLARIESGLRLLAATGGAALDSLDLDETLRNIASAFVADFASYCIIDVREDGRWHRTGVHVDPSREALLLDVSEPTDDHPIARALREGNSAVVTVDAAWSEATHGAEDRSELVRVLGVRSFITVPVIKSGGEVVGALTAAIDATSSRENYTADDLGFVEEVGRRAGAAIEFARSYKREQRIAAELQAASLPATLPHSAELFLNADYRPGSDEATIGGDWYDAFRLDDGRIGITVGDVLGHGLGAAVTMTKLRAAMQSAAMVNPDPNVMLNVADKTLRLVDADAYATAIAAIYDPLSETLIFASAGHPGPALRTSDGKVQEFTSIGLMLGLRDGDETNTVTFAAPHEATVVFYTDGLVEATRDIETGYRRLHEALSDPSVLEGPEPARALVDLVLNGRSANDDVAVLVARIGAPAR
ncbi:MAG: hypothetical protein NVS3B28_17300 [Candidatus Velthaea sp.]